MSSNQPTIVADFGNTRCKLGRFEEGQIAETVHLPYTSLTSTGLHSLFQDVDRVTSISVVDTSTVETIIAHIQHALNSPLQHQPLSKEDASRNINLNGYPLEQLGTDRLINVIAAKQVNPNSPVLVIDIGTATTLDAWHPEQGYLGGLIIPGLQPFWQTLNQVTSKLPVPPIEAVTQTFGTNTQTSIQRGVGFGYIRMLHALITDLQRGFSGKEPLIYWTGGGSGPALELANNLNTPLPCDGHDPRLTLKGIYYAS